MFDFLKELFNSKDSELTVLLLDDENPENANTYTFRPTGLLLLVYGFSAGLVIVTLLVMMFTPLGGALYNTEDSQLRSQIIEISEKVRSLQDSLRARDNQLGDIQQVMMTGQDTTFRVDGSIEQRQLFQSDNSFPGMAVMPTYDMISEDDIISSGLIRNETVFPVSYPVEGSLSRGYSSANRHFGIDIATRTGEAFRSLADGAVVSQEWTVNYGYVIHVQHADGLLTVYKHVTNLSKTPGDIVMKGDILGTVGDTGVLSSGPHLHLEIWKNGVPQNPNSYLIKP